MAGVFPSKPLSSVRLHEKFGFKKVAHFKEVSFKFNHWIDVAYWQLNL
jgi:phosphinothricin acetyltransferase